VVVVTFLTDFIVNNMCVCVCVCVCVLYAYSRIDLFKFVEMFVFQTVNLLSVDFCCFMSVR